MDAPARPLRRRPATATTGSRRRQVIALRPCWGAATVIGGRPPPWLVATIDDPGDCIIVSVFINPPEWLVSFVSAGGPECCGGNGVDDGAVGLLSHPPQVAAGAAGPVTGHEVDVLPYRHGAMAHQRGRQLCHEGLLRLCSVPREDLCYHPLKVLYFLSYGHYKDSKQQK